MARKLIDCRDHPSVSNCTIAMTADTADEVVDLAVLHAVAKHGHPDSPELREMLRGAVREAALA